MKGVRFSGKFTDLLKTLESQTNRTKKAMFYVEFKDVKVEYTFSLQ